MARASTDGKSGLAENDTSDNLKPRDSGVTDRSSSGGGHSVDGTMTGRSHTWQELKEEADEKKTAKNGSGSDNGIGNSFVAVKRGSTDEVPIEMDRITGAGLSAHAPFGAVPPDAPEARGCDGMTAPAAAPAGIEYKVYKRRWFGLAQLTLLNIIVSWDVSILITIVKAPTRAHGWPRISRHTDLLRHRAVRFFQGIIIFMELSHGLECCGWLVRRCITMHMYNSTPLSQPHSSSSPFVIHTERT